MNTNEKRVRNCVIVLFVLYTAAMLYLLFLERVIHDPSLFYHREEGVPYAVNVLHHVNLTPLVTIKGFAREVRAQGMDVELLDFAFDNLAGNILFFMPVGLFLPYFWKWQRHPVVFFFTDLMLIGCVEITQALALVGTCDIDDVILNVLGGCAGLVLYHGIRFFYRRYTYGNPELT